MTATTTNQTLKGKLLDRLAKAQAIVEGGQYEVKDNEVTLVSDTGHLWRVTSAGCSKGGEPCMDAQIRMRGKCKHWFAWSLLTKMRTDGCGLDEAVAAAQEWIERDYYGSI